MIDEYKVVRIKNLTQLNDIQGSEEILVDTVNYAKKINVDILVKYIKDKIDTGFNEDQIKDMIKEILDNYNLNVSDPELPQNDSGIVYIQRVYTETRNLNIGDSITFALPTSKVNGLATQLFINENLKGIEDVNLTVSGNQVQFISPETISNAKCVILYSSSAKELPKNYQYVSVDITLDDSNVTINGLFDARFKQEGSSLNVDWGDGIIETIYCDSTLKILGEHTYQNAGVYTVSLVDEFGQLTGCYFNNQSIKCVSKVNRVEGTEIVSLGNMFANQPMDIQFASGFQFKTPNVTSISNMFGSCGVTLIPDGIFDILTQCVNISKLFDKSKIQIIQTGLFDNMIDLNDATVLARQSTDLHTVGSALFKNKKKLLNAQLSFQGCVSLSNIGDEIYSGCELLTSVLSVFESTGNIIVGPNMFKGCIALENVSSLFYKSQLTSIPAELFIDCQNINNINGLFRMASQLLAIPDKFLENKTKITTMNLAFNNMTSCTYIPSDLLDAFIDKITEATGTFQASNKFTTNINELISRKMVALVSGGSMFYGCSSITGTANDIIPLIPEDAIHSGFFKLCSMLSDFATIPTGWK